MPDYLVDTHCHFFNIDDIPIYQFLNRLEMSLGLRTGLVAGGLATGLIKSALKDFKTFFTFFESPRDVNIVRTCNEYCNALQADPNLGDAFAQRTKIMTPLIMDFEPNQPHECLIHQTQALLDAIQQARNELPADLKILPFLGLSMQRLIAVANPDDADAWVDQFLQTELPGGLKTRQQRQDPAQLDQGDVIGIKLYPPLGFDPFPGSPYRTTYQRAYRRLWQHHRLPFTVHCQPAAYALISDHERWTDPKNWQSVLRYNNRELGDLHINFGHFGGDSELQKAIVWERVDNFRYQVRKIDTQSWTYSIIKMLKEYPNTYADISAFDWADFDTSISFRAILTLDENGVFDEDLPNDYSLSDKLLWGSDYPMMLGRAKDYETLLDLFRRSFGKKRRMGYLYDLRGQFPNQPDIDVVMEKLFNANPRKFLFG